MDKELSIYKKVLAVDIDEVVRKITSLTKQTKSLTRKGPSSRYLTPADAFKLYSTYGLSKERLKRKGYIKKQRQPKEDPCKGH